MRYYYINIENGNILTYAEMLEEAAELYDVGDDTNPIGWEEYYELTDIPVDDPGRVQEARAVVENERARLDI